MIPVPVPVPVPEYQRNKKEHKSTKRRKEGVTNTNTNTTEFPIETIEELEDLNIRLMTGTEEFKAKLVRNN